MITGDAFTGSSTPPICAAADRCTRLPIWAHEPTSACESTIVPSSTYAPALMYAGGIITTPRATNAPDRTELPPGTIRTPSSGVNRRAGYVPLSTNERIVLPGGASPLISVSEPRRKPSRRPRFTHVFTRHPVGALASGSADRSVPASSAARSSRNAAIAAASPTAAMPAAKYRSILGCKSSSSVVMVHFNCSGTQKDDPLPAPSTCMEQNMRLLEDVPIGIPVPGVCASNSDVAFALEPPTAHARLERGSMHGGNDIGRAIVSTRLQLEQIGRASC